MLRTTHTTPRITRPTARRWRRLALILTLALALLLAACGGDDGDDDATAPDTEPDTAAEDADLADETDDEDADIDFDDNTPTPIPTPVPDDEPDIVPTLSLAEEDALFQEAATEAQLDLADDLGISFESVSVVDPETALLLPASLDCPDIDLDTPVDVYMVYVQVDATIYPYQFYRIPPGASFLPPDEDDEVDEVDDMDEDADTGGDDTGDTDTDTDADDTSADDTVMDDDDDASDDDTLLVEDNALIVERCGETLVDDDVLTAPDASGPGSVLELVRADLQARGVDSEAGRFTTVSAMTWTDAALGCAPPQDPTNAEPNPTPAPAMTDGYLVIYEVGERVYEYHTDLTGEQIVYCEPPIGYASPAAFISVLMQEEIYDVLDLEETTTYAGLDAEAQVIGLLPQAYRVGLIGFDTPEAARAAAQQIDATDENVAHIFVSGYIVIVLEENSPQVYSVLLSYAELVRSPLEEREQLADEAAAAEDAALDDDAAADAEAEGEGD